MAKSSPARVRERCALAGSQRKKTRRSTEAIFVKTQIPMAIGAKLLGAKLSMLLQLHSAKAAGRSCFRPLSRRDEPAFGCPGVARCAPETLLIRIRLPLQLNRRRKRAASADSARVLKPQKAVGRPGSTRRPPRPPGPQSGKLHHQF